MLCFKLLFIHFSFENFIVVSILYQHPTLFNYSFDNISIHD